MNRRQRWWLYRYRLRQWAADPEKRALFWLGIGLWLLFQMGAHYPVREGVKLPEDKCAGTVVVKPNSLKIELVPCPQGAE